MTKIECSECEGGVLRPKTVEHDMGPLLGMTEVRVTNLSALVCSRCGAVSVDGSVIEMVSLMLADVILRQPAIGGIEVRFLRKLLGDTQSELAAKLGVDRATVNRWENADEPLTGAPSYALRSHALLRLQERGARLLGAEAELRRPEPKPPRRRGGYRLDAAAEAR